MMVTRIEPRNIQIIQGPTFISKKARKEMVRKSSQSPWIAYSPFPCLSLPPLGSDIPPEGLTTTSIDIGIKNFALRIEKHHSNGLILPVFFDKIDFTQTGLDTNDTSGVATIDARILTSATQFMQKIMPLISESRLIGIERQMAVNIKSTKMFQHILTILLLYAPSFRYPDCIIFDLCPKLKGNILGAPKGLSYSNLKEWSVNKAIELLERRKDNWSLQVIQHHRGKSKTKADDLADTIIQMEAWFILNHAPGSQLIA